MGLRASLEVVAAVTTDRIHDIRTIHCTKHQHLLVPVRKGDEGLAICDVSTPNNPTFLDHFSEEIDGASEAIPIDPEEHTVIVSDRNGGRLTTLDIADPSNIRLLDAVEDGATAEGRYLGARRMHYHDGTVFCAFGHGAGPGQNAALGSFDVSDPTNIDELQYLTQDVPSIGYVRRYPGTDLLFCGGYRTNAFGVVDISDPANMAVIAFKHYDVAESMRDVHLDPHRDLAFVAEAEAGENRGGIHVIDISEPGSLDAVAFFSHPALAGTRGLSPDPTYPVLYASARRADRATVVDISDPTNLGVLASTGHESMVGCHGNHFSDGHLFIGNADGGGGYVTVIKPEITA